MTSYEDSLRTAAEHMHRLLACRDNASSVLVKSMAQLGRPLPESIAAAILTLGNAHAPITQACRLWNKPHEDFKQEIAILVRNNQKIPGWGGSFAAEGEPDPVLSTFDDEFPPSLLYKRNEMTAAVQEVTGKAIHPNAALYTAMFADVLALTPEQAPELALCGRLPVLCWAWRENYDGSVQ